MSALPDKAADGEQVNSTECRNPKNPTQQAAQSMVLSVLTGGWDHTENKTPDWNNRKGHSPK